jgi:hypothetical protein
MRVGWIWFVRHKCIFFILHSYISSHLAAHFTDVNHVIYSITLEFCAILLCDFLNYQYRTGQKVPYSYIFYYLIGVIYLEMDG